MKSWLCATSTCRSSNFRRTWSQTEANFTFVLKGVGRTYENKAFLTCLTKFCLLVSIGKEFKLSWSSASLQSARDLLKCIPSVSQQTGFQNVLKCSLEYGTIFWQISVDTLLHKIPPNTRKQEKTRRLVILQHADVVIQARGYPH